MINLCIGMMKLKNKNSFLRMVNQDVYGYINPFIPVAWEYKQRWSYDVKIRDEFRCQICGSSKHIVSHHIIYRHEYPQFQLIINNGICLCKPCEDQAHGRELKTFIPKHIRVPSLKQMIRNRSIPWYLRLFNRIKKLLKNR